MGEQTDTAQLIDDLQAALPALARDALAAAIASTTLPGAEGVALREPLRSIAADEIDDLARVAGRIAALGGTPDVSVQELSLPKTWKAAVNELARLQRETLDVVVAAIPADADDAEGEATEHLLEHVVARKRDAIELLERATR
jgi:bacterioferritin (cytochrome b1)